MNQFHPNRTNAAGALFFGITALLSALTGGPFSALILGAAGVFLGIVTRRYAAPGEGGGMPVVGITLSAAGIVIAALVLAVLAVGGFAAPAAPL